MSRLSRLLSVVCLGAAATMASFAAEHNPMRPVPHPTASAESARVIVKLKERANALALSTATPSDRVRAAGTFGMRLNLALDDGRALGPRTQVLKAHGISSRELAARLAKDPEVEWAVPSYRRYPQLVPNDPLFPNGLTGTTPIVGQWYLRVPGAPDNLEAVSAIDAQTAWNFTTGTAAVVIADLDSGIRNHPDLTGALLPNASRTAWPPYGYDFIGYSSNDGAGAIPTANDGDAEDDDASDPGDWIDAGDQTHSYFKPEDCPIEDSDWHGTQTAGIMSAQMNNGQGMAGIAPGARLLPVRVLGKCGGWDDDIQAGMLWAAGVSVPGIPLNLHPARVLNMSLGRTCTPDDPDSCTCLSSYADVFATLTARNVIVAVSAGNDEGLQVGVPGNCQGAFTVAALRHVGDKVGFSNIGPEVDISAPGGNCVNGEDEACLYPILTTSDTGLTSPVSPTYTTSFLTPSLGTSFSAPMVSATAALMLSVAPALTTAQVRQILQRTATPFPTTGGTPGTPVCHAPDADHPQEECYCTTTTCGAGMLNARAAVSAAALLATPQAIIVNEFGTVDVGSSIALSGAASTASAGETITNYVWELTVGASTVATLNTSTGSSVTLTGVAPGAATVQLTITDSSGAVSTTTAEVTVNAPPGDDDGGGAANPLWLLGLAAAGLWLAPRRRRN
jgi:serine protease